MQCHQQFVDKSEPRSAAEASLTQIFARSSAGNGPRFLRPSVQDGYRHTSPTFQTFTKLALDSSDSPTINGDTLRAFVELGVFQGTAILSFADAVLDWFVKDYDKTALEATGPTQVSGTACGGKRKSDSHADGPRPDKQRKVEERPPGRNYLQMRGSKANDGQICSNIQHGYLDFIDSAWTKCKGVSSRRPGCRSQY